MKEIGKIYLVDIDTLNAGSFNPPTRTKDTPALRKLVASMVSVKFLPFMPIIAAEDGTIIDGHRRWEAAKRAKLTEVPVIFTNLSASATFALINGDSRKPLNGKQWLSAYVHGVALEDLPSRFRAQISTIIETCGNDAIHFLYNHDIAPDAITVVSRATNRINVERPTAKLSTFDVLKWAVNKKQLFPLRKWLDYNLSVDELISSISGNRVLKRKPVD